MSFWCFKNLDGKPAEPMRPDESKAPADGVLDIDGPIAAEQWFGDEVSSREFRQQLKSLRNVTVHINSPGGDVMAGAEIYSALREHSLNGRGKVTVIVTALAASAASVVAMAGDEILMSPVAYMMIHNPWSLVAGDAREMRKIARTLDEIAEGIITAYQRRTGKSRDQLKRMLDNETYMCANTCVEEGFADGIYGGEIRAAACAGTGMMTRATPESVRELCARWEASHRAGISTEAEAEPEEEKPNEEPEETAERSEKEPENPEQEPDEGADPAEGDPEEANDPEEPEEGEDPEEPDDREAKDRIVKRCAAIAAYAETALRMMKEEFQ